ncbi:MAG: tetratricopeptide repeat-containing protein [Ginsengibacter sp.]
MTKAFIIRPFGIKQDVDFERVDKELIQPALKQLNIVGITTTAIVEQGNIREDMFAQLLIADLVVADLSIHNANVFYELGIRHSLRDKKTFLIRCSKDEIPFDIKTDRYLNYPADDPSSALQSLVAGLKATMISERIDSPVFYMLPKLVSQNPEQFLAVPPDFGEEVELARAGRQIGKLALLASEAEGFAWQVPAFRNVAEALYRLKDFEASGLYWEKVRDTYPYDDDANDLLATIYQRLAETEMITNPTVGWELLKRSDQAVERLLINKEKFDINKRAEIYSLRARNSKVKWVGSWKNVAEAERKEKALQSTYLKDAYDEYERAYNEDLNHFYSGINALGLLTVIISLAEKLPDFWNLEFDTEEEAQEILRKYKARQQKLQILVQASIEAGKKRALEDDKLKLWISISEADLACLTLTKALRVQALYQKVIQESNDLNFDSARRQLLIYEQLNVQSENVKAALAAFLNAKVFEEQPNQNYILFTGHMIDKPDRIPPRFTPDKEEVVRATIKEQVLKEKNKIKGQVKGIAGGACGGDILFHEVCSELGIATELFLALPREQFVVESVEFAGPQWVERFDDLYRKLPRRILSQTKELPKWLQKKPDYTIWERNNLWMLNSSLVCGGQNMTLLALWEGKGGDKPGGTRHMVKEAETRGSKTVIIDFNKIAPA